MQSETHKQHILTRMSHNNCQECRADIERRLTDNSTWTYNHVSTYLAYVKPRIQAIQNGEDSTNARVWLRGFQLALNRRITSKIKPTVGRKYCDSYLERIKQTRSGTCDSTYLRKFAKQGASALS